MDKTKILHTKSMLPTFILTIMITLGSFAQSYALKNIAIKRIEAEMLKNEFQNPPLDARPKLFWRWATGNFDLQQISIEMKESKEKGMIGFDIWDVGSLADLENKVPAESPFMGEDSVKAIVHTINEAGKYEMELGLIPASSWNNAGSCIEPRYGVMGILYTPIIVKENQTIHLKLPLPDLQKITGYGQKNLLDTLGNGLPTYYEEIAVLAIPKGKTNISNNEILNLSDAFSGEILVCQLPGGEWEITRYVSTDLDVSLKRPSPNSNGLMIDHFSKEAQQSHLKFLMDKLTPYFGNNFQNTTLKYLYNDSYEVKGSFRIPKMIEKTNENSLSMKIGETDFFEISGTWKLSFPKGFGAPQSAEFPQLISWTESSVPGIRYFSGIARYEIEFDFEKINKNKSFLLNPGDVKDLADIKLYGDNLGVIWHPPFEMDITNHLREGKNQMAIEDANLLNKHLVGDDKLPGKRRVTNTNIVKGPIAWMKPWDEVPLKEFGLMETVVIKTIN